MVDNSVIKLLVLEGREKQASMLFLSEKQSIVDISRPKIESSYHFLKEEKNRVVCCSLMKSGVQQTYIGLKLNCLLECVLPSWSKHLRCISKLAKIRETYQLFSVKTDLYRRIERAKRNLEHSFSDLELWERKLED